MNGNWHSIIFFKSNVDNCRIPFVCGALPLYAISRVVCFIFFTSSCNNIFYQPSKHFFNDPKILDFVYEDIYIKNQDGTKLHGWFFPVDGKINELGTIIQFHGNAENISTHFRSLSWIVKYGYNLIIFDYRGYGKSEGIPNHKKVLEDTILMLEYAVKRNEERMNILEKRFSSKKNSEKAKLKLIAYGQSLGGIILLRALEDFTKKSKIKATVIDSSFSSYRQIAKEKLSLAWITWLFQPFAYILISDHYAPQKIGEISPIPLLVIHGDKDNIVPLHHGKKIFDIAKKPKWFWQIEGGKHIDSMTSHNGLYRRKLIIFFETL